MSQFWATFDVSSFYWAEMQGSINLQVIKALSPQNVACLQVRER